ncbi:putative transmembrane protein [Gregarina niphandrodes]|uniref:Transmembrane protein n=1 Tax=Gregarina niphandrodes TaxID=110365 RepID=A0A023AYE6_GRENI|nr:putative transmembrane protein [Gregarina niphandrodes]EZG43453.1 putative transmembrane protein [Gregarina niphandrodes]|eukprot:XP_011133304.1 putative transmembrane protein [Gregarina niphandrodes]
MGTGSVIDSAIESVIDTPELAVSAEKFPKWFVMTVMVLTGVVHLWFWNTILNLTVTVNGEYFPSHSRLSDVLATVFQACNIAAFLITNTIGALRPWLNTVAGVVYLVASVCLPLVLLMPETPRYYCWVVLVGVFGLVSGTQQVHHFAIASIYPTGHTTALVSAGQGVGGIVSYGLCMIMVQAAKLSPMNCVIIQMTLGFVWATCSIIGIALLSSQQSVQDSGERQRLEMEAYVAENGKPRIQDWIQWVPLVNTFYSFLSSYLVFPNIGPFKWPMRDDNQVNVVMGLSQLGQVLGRSVPNWSIFIVSLKTTSISNAVKTVLIPVFVVTAVNNNTVFNSYWFQCILLFILSFSEGYLGTLGLVHSAISGKDIYAKWKMATFSTGALVIGVGVGLWVSPLIQKAAKI